MSYIDVKFINMISPKLEKFSWKDQNVAHCRCPICGDSKKNKNKKRFYIFEQKGLYYVKCHNCGYSSVFSKFLEKIDNNLYRSYVFEKYNNKYSNVQEKKIIYKDDTKEKLLNCNIINYTKVCDLDDSHYCKQYVINRKIPSKYYNILFYTENYKDFAMQIDSNKIGLIEEPRLVIPFYDKNGEIFAAQGRSLDPKNSLRYITVRNPEYEGRRFYGLERHDRNKITYIVEGPIDSLFLENAIAIAGSDSIRQSDLPCEKSNVVFVYDNENRNAEILRSMKNAISNGYKICIWPDDLKQKDINDMILSNLDPVNIIKSNTYSGLHALNRFNQWRKV